MWHIVWEENVYQVLVGKPEGKQSVESLGIDGRKTLSLVLKK
jgi:hypothetical protein